LGLSLCAAKVCTAGPEPALTGFNVPRDGLPRVQAPKSAFQSFRFLSESTKPESTEEIIGKFAYRISYFGSFLLTADRLVRSMDSVMESMQVERPDGTCLRLCAEPGSRGFEVGLRLSRPIDF
jgi:hypothetical protein